MKFMFMTRQGARITECTEFEAHELLREYAADHGLRVDAHRGGWEGNALSVAYQPDGDSLLHCEAVVRPQQCTHAQLTVLQVAEHVSAAGVSLRAFWQEAAGGDRTPMPVAAVEAVLARMEARS